MTFKHKLSARLALMKAALALLPLALIFACGVGDQPISGPTKTNALTSAPAAGTLLFQESFEDNSFAARGWYDNTAMAITNTQHVAGSANALEVHFLPGATQPTWGGSARHLFPASPTLYISYWVKYSDNWVGSAHTYHPHEFLVLSDLDGDFDGPSNNWMTTYVEQNYQNGGIPRVQLQDNKAINSSLGTPPFSLVGTTENRSVDGCNGVVEANVVTTCFNMPPWYNDKEFSAGQVAFQPTAGAGYKGNWNHVEAYFQINSITGGIGQADGVVQYWFNGTLMIDRHDVLFRTGARPSINFHQFIIAPWIGDGSPADQYMWVDNLTVATGPLSSPAQGSVAAVTVSPATASVGTGLTSQLTATATDSAGNVLSGQAFTWTSSNTAVATVTATGLVTGVAAGTATITASSGGKSGSGSITVTAPAIVPVAAVAVSPTSANVAVGATRQMSVTLTSAAGATLTGRAVTWTSSAPATATVSSAGLVKAVKTGIAIITATSEGVSGTATINVTAVKPSTVTNLAVASVSDTSATLSFTEVNDGTGRPASYEVRFAAGTLSWGSAPDVANGTCKVPVAGTAIGAKRTCTVLGLAAAKAYQFQVVAFRGTLNVNAVFGALSNKASGTTLAKSVAAPVASVTLAPATASLAAGATQQLTATLKDSSGNTLTGRTITWASSAPAVATVNASGLVTAVAAGSATITATSETKSGTAAITVTAPVVTNPGTVTDLAVAGVTNNSVTLSFTEVTGGSGSPASYDVRYAAGSMSWGSAPSVTNGTCAVPLAGTAIGAKRSCTVLGLAASTAYQFEVVAYRGTLNVDAVFGALSNVASGTTVAGPVSTAPVASVSLSPASMGLMVGGTQQLAATLKDSSGNVLTGRTVTWSSSAPLLATVSGGGMVSAVAAGADTITATSEGMSGKAAVTITQSVTGGGVVFQSDWTSGTGLSTGAISDGGRWQNYWEFNNGTGVQLLSVVDGASVNAPGGRNALKVLQRGSNLAANLQQANIVPAMTDYYVRFFMRNDDTSPAGDHVVTVDTWQYGNLLYVRKYSSAAGWTFTMGVYGCGYVYPIGYWTPPVTLSHGVWYRFEYYVHWVDATHIQVHPRLYDAAGNLMYDDSGYQQSDPGSASWNGKSDWTLASYYAAGNNFCVDPTYMTTFGVGNNGQQGAVDTGLPWYYAGIQIRTDHWVGP